MIYSYYYEIEIKGGIKYLALPAFKINFRAISALASSSPITIQTTSVLIFRHKTIFCLNPRKKNYMLYIIEYKNDRYATCEHRRVQTVVKKIEDRRYRST